MATSVLRFLFSFGSLLFAYLPRFLQVTYQAGYYSDYMPVLGVQEVHIAQGKDPTTMVISWLVPLAFGSPGITLVCMFERAMRSAVCMLSIEQKQIIPIAKQLNLRHLLVIIRSL